MVVITRNLGMTVAQSTQLRNKMRDAGARYKVTKNTLTLIALEGTTYAPISEMLTGPTALATSSDPVSAAKVAVDFAKTNDRFEIVGGAMGDTVLDLNGVKALAELPRSMNCVPRSWASSWRPRPRSRGPSANRERSWRASSAPMRRKKTPEYQREPWAPACAGARSETGDLTWQTSIPSSISCPS